MSTTYCPIDALPDLGPPSADVIAMRRKIIMKEEEAMKTKTNNSTSSMKRASSKFYDARDLDVVGNVPAPITDVFRASSNSSPASVFDFPPAPLAAPMMCYTSTPSAHSQHKLQKKVRFSRTRPQTIVYQNVNANEVWIPKNELKRNREKRARETNVWQTKGHPPFLLEAFYNPKVSDLADFCSLDNEEDHMRGAEHYVCENHAVTRVKAKNRVVRGILERLSELELQQPSKTPKEIADELAALSLTLTDPAKNFARMMGIADAIAACEEEEEEENLSSVEGGFSGSTTTIASAGSDDQEGILSESSSNSTSSHNCYHDAVEEIVPHPSLLKPRAVRVAVPKRVEKKIKKGKDPTSSKRKDKKDRTNKSSKSTSLYQRKLTGGSLTIAHQQN